MVEAAERVVTALVIHKSDWQEFLVLRERIRALLSKQLDPAWKFVHTRAEPVISWEGCKIIMGRSDDGR